MSSEHLNILGVKVSAVNIDIASQIIDDWIKTRTKTYVCVVPVSTVVSCQEDKNYLEIINNAGMATPDGMPLVWIGRIRGEKQLRRTYGPDLMLAVCRDSQRKHYFYGGTEDTNKLLVSQLRQLFPTIHIAGAYAPPFSEQYALEDSAVLDEINRISPDIIWVGLGSPKQDYWIYNHRDKLNAPVLIGVGAAFDFISGVKKQAPRWMQQAGLEWCFRLCCEPKRLWKRYFVGNSKFIYYILKDLITNRNKSRV